MSQNIPRLPVHPAGEQPPVEQVAGPAPATLDTWAGPVRVEWDPAGTADALRAAPVLHRLSQGREPVRRARGRLPAQLYEPERAGKARCAWHHCQRRSNFRPAWRSKNRPVGMMMVQKHKAPSRWGFMLFRREFVASYRGSISPVSGSTISLASASSAIDFAALRRRLLDCLSR